MHINDVRVLVIRKYPRAKITIEDKGPSSQPSIHRYALITELFGSKIQINVSENVVLLIDDAPMKILRHTGMNSTTTIVTTINAWLDQLPHLVSRTDRPLVKQYARKYLGQEQGIHEGKKEVQIHYDKFIVIISPTLGLVMLSSNARVVQSLEITTPDEVELFFRGAKFTAQAIRDGQIH